MIVFLISIFAFAVKGLDPISGSFKKITPTNQSVQIYAREACGPCHRMLHRLRSMQTKGWKIQVFWMDPLPACQEMSLQYPKYEHLCVADGPAATPTTIFTLGSKTVRVEGDRSLPF